MKTFNLIVIGSGPGGYSTAADAAAAGLHTAIIEKDDLGGTCLNRGCIPTKALCHSADVARTVANAAAAGVEVDRFTFNYSIAVARKNAVVESLREGVEQLLSGVEIIHGEASFSGPRTILVNGEEFTADKIIIATGSQPARLKVPGAERAVNSDFILNMTSLPGSIVIIGGGVIGMEFASIFSAFGVKVTVLEYCPEILPQFDTEIAKRLRMTLKRKGIEFVTSAAVTAITENTSVTADVKGKQKIFTADMVLVATGRTPVLPASLDLAGIELTPRGFIKVDSTTMQTTAPGIYAIGDVNGLCMLAHAATAQGQKALGKNVNTDIIPAAVFTTPECAMVGLTEQQCTSQNLNVTVGTATFRANGKALAMDMPEGLVKIIASKTDGRILGCHICGAHAADLIQEVAIAMTAGLTAADIAQTIHSHPTLSETLHSAACRLLS